MITVVLFFLAGILFYSTFRIFGRKWTVLYWAVLILFAFAVGCIARNFVIVCASVAVMLFLWDDLSNFDKK
jgi:hypothetical protein